MNLSAIMGVVFVGCLAFGVLAPKQDRAKGVSVPTKTTIPKSHNQFRGAPTHATDLRQARIRLIDKDMITIGWIEKTFNVSDSHIAEAIYESIEEYDGPCPCPYNMARDGKTCGGRSAYSRSGGEEPVCYPDDVSN